MEDLHRRRRRWRVELEAATGAVRRRQYQAGAPGSGVETVAARVEQAQVGPAGGRTVLTSSAVVRLPPTMVRTAAELRTGRSSRPGGTGRSRGRSGGGGLAGGPGAGRSRGRPGDQAASTASAGARPPAAQSVTVSAAHGGRSAGQAARTASTTGAGSAAVPPAAQTGRRAGWPGETGTRRAGSRGPGRPAAPAPRRRRPADAGRELGGDPFQVATVHGRRDRACRGVGDSRGGQQRPAAARAGPVDPVAAGPGGAAAGVA